MGERDANELLIKHQSQVKSHDIYHIIYISVYIYLYIYICIYIDIYIIDIIILKITIDSKLRSY